MNFRDLSKRLGNDIAVLPRIWKRVILLSFDVVALGGAVWVAYALRFGNWTPPRTFEQFALIASAPVIAIPVFIRLGLYRAVLRYLPERALWTIIQGMTIAALCWVAFMFLAETAWRGVFPRSVPIIYWAIGVALIAGSRFTAKWLLMPRTPRREDRPFLIYGANESGAQLATSLQPTRSVVGFLDDNVTLQNREVAGLMVYPPSELPQLAAQYGVADVILSMPSLSSRRRREIVASIVAQGIRVRVLPHIGDVASGKYTVSQIREIDIDELLGRSSVPADPDLIRETVSNRSILVTGAGGSIGSELCRLLVKWSPRKLVLMESNEFALYNIERELAGSATVVPVLGSVADAAVARETIVNHQIEVVFHAAAHKHVPLVEANPLEGMRNNILGTRTIADAAFENGVNTFVLISSDKAVRPTNVMGATKRWAELIVQEKAMEASAAGTGQRFCSVRFGNVLGSNGSVVPLFKEQIAAGGPVTITDLRMTRYFMSIHEAAELIVQASALSKGGDVLLLDMGEPILIKDLAENMIRLAGLTPRQEGDAEGDIEIVVTGMRPGEKLFEELFYDATNASPTRHPKIMQATDVDVEAKDVEAALLKLEGSLQARNEGAARQTLFEFIG